MDETNLFECVVTDEYEGYRIDKLISELIDFCINAYIISSPVTSIRTLSTT